jgi:hypothetical protein
MNGKRLAALGIACLVLAQVVLSFGVVPKQPRSSLPEGWFADLPPGEQVGLLMLGGFRGLAIDLLWLRAVNAKDEGRFFESVALFDLISRVQPRFERVWEYMSWDLAYNIAHEMDDPDGKWSWFLAGVEVQARGTQQNPQSRRLLKQLAWLFHHKGESFTDRIVATDFSGLLNPILSRYDDSLMVNGAGYSNYALAERCYFAAIDLADGVDIPMPAFIRRMGALMQEMDARWWLEQDQPLQACRRYLECVKSWDAVLGWSVEPDNLHRQIDAKLTLESYERNAGRARRRLAELIRRLHQDTQQADALVVDLWRLDYAPLDQALADPTQWRESVPTLRIHWLDEAP